MLNAWDFSLSTPEQAGDLKKSIAEQVKLVMEEEKLAETLKSRTRHRVAVVTVINSILPTVISLLTKLEKWDDVGFSIKAMVTRLYLAKILNVLIQLFSYALLLNPYLLTSAQSVAGLATFDGSKSRSRLDYWRLSSLTSH
uniref:Uncharacterized protein n=1 Tax=Globisporangium ultimum (strain ATCC 200006 / CBS 805.95 / DAOM BR144) TaxID=431595 RepID=K3WCX7_GLOUD